MTKKNEIVLSMDDLMRMMNERRDPIAVAIEKLTQWPEKCPGPCFPLVYRGYLSHPDFLRA